MTSKKRAPQRSAENALPKGDPAALPKGDRADVTRFKSAVAKRLRAARGVLKLSPLFIIDRS
jgi:hypothetical protein